MPRKSRATSALPPPVQALLDLLDLLDEAFDRRSWHGPNLQSALKGLAPDEAVRRPAPGRHNAQELIVHCAYWKYVVWRKVTGASRDSFVLDGSNFFPRSTPDADALRADLVLLREQHARLRLAVALLAPKDLGRKVSARSLAWMIRGAAAHDLYHAGQIRLLRRLSEVAGVDGV